MTCASTRNWRSHRALLFLDPIRHAGLHVTPLLPLRGPKPSDLLAHFSHLGTGANRLLKRDGNIPASWRARLNATFGASTGTMRSIRMWNTTICWARARSQKRTNRPTSTQSATDFLKRLGTVFPLCSKTPATSIQFRQQCPLYLSCFAAGNLRESGGTDWFEKSTQELF